MKTLAMHSSEGNEMVDRLSSYAIQSDFGGGIRASAAARSTIGRKYSTRSVAVLMSGTRSRAACCPQARIHLTLCELGKDASFDPSRPDRDGTTNEYDPGPGRRASCNDLATWKRGTADMKPDP